MDDTQIIELYWNRSENAISETAAKYGRYCHYIAYNITHDEQDSEECVNDTYMHTWESIPPKRPDFFKAFLGTITRNISLDRYEKYSAKKRGMGQVSLVYEEMQECLPSEDACDEIADDILHFA